MADMRAKLRVTGVSESRDANNEKTGETVSMQAVGPSSYPEDGTDENNTFAKFTPSANFSAYILNPALFDKFTVGKDYYVDFTAADE